jgi:cobalamin biosynthesis protein CobD
VVLTVGGASAAAWGILDSLQHVHPLARTVGETLLAWYCLAARSLHGESKRVADALTAGDPDGARQWLSRIVGRDTAHLDEPEIWRGTVETGAENSSDGVIAPLFYLMLGGPVLALTYKAVNTLDSMVGYKNERYLQFGWAAARLDDLVNWLPARLTGLLLVSLHWWGSRAGEHGGSCGVTGAGTVRPMPVSPRRRWPGHSAYSWAGPTSTSASRWQNRQSVTRHGIWTNLRIVVQSG